MSDLITWHVSNAVVDSIPEKQLVHRMWEDSDLEGLAEATERCLWIDRYAPNQFVFIRTGDYVIAECSCLDFDERNHDCDTYDADYCLYMVPAVVWDDCRDRVLQESKAWRESLKSCRKHPELPIAQLNELNDLVLKINGHLTIYQKKNELKIFCSADPFFPQIYALDETGICAALSHMVLLLERKGT